MAKKVSKLQAPLRAYRKTLPVLNAFLTTKAEAHLASLLLKGKQDAFLGQPHMQVLFASSRNL